MVKNKNLISSIIAQQMGGVLQETEQHAESDVDGKMAICKFMKKYIKNTI